jgi:hypothetical protein
LISALTLESIMNMNIPTPVLSVPQPADALVKIAELMNRLPFGDLSEARRAEIMRGAFGPVVLMIEAVQLAAAAGPDEESVFINFIRSIYAQAEISRREQYFSHLIEGLNALRPGGKLSH